MKITIEAETPNDSAGMFKVALDERPIGGNPTAVQAQIVAFEIIERIIHPKVHDR